MVKMTLPSIETRYCQTNHEAFASGDQLCYLIEDDWTIAKVDHDIYLKRGRRVIVYVFTLYRDEQWIQVSVVSTPYIAKLAKAHMAAAAERYQRARTLEDISVTA